MPGEGSVVDDDDECLLIKKELHVFWHNSVMSVATHIKNVPWYLKKII